MADSKADFIRDIFERWNEGGGREPRADELHPEIEIHSRVAELMRGGGPYRGLDGARQWVRDLDDAFGQFQLNIEESREVGERLLVLGSIDIRGRGGEIELHELIGWVFDFTDGRILRMRTFRTYAEALKAAGVDA